VIDTARERSLAPEEYRVNAWRVDQLVRAGYPPTKALILAIDPDVDLELARRLLRQGCPPSLAHRILS
jgi:hypothetical protein